MKRAISKRITHGIGILLCAYIMPGHADEIRVNQSLPTVTLKPPAGQLILSEDSEISYAIWNSEQLSGKVRTIYHLAARLGIDEINQTFFDILDQKNFPNEKYVTLTILNIDDVFFGGSAFARSRFEASRKKYPNAEFVVDDTSQARESWNLAPQGSAVIIIDQYGKVLKFKDGALDRQEIVEFIRAIETNL